MLRLCQLPGHGVVSRALQRSDYQIPRLPQGPYSAATNRRKNERGTSRVEEREREREGKAQRERTREKRAKREKQKETGKERETEKKEGKERETERKEQRETSETKLKKRSYDSVIETARQADVLPHSLTLLLLLFYI